VAQFRSINLNVGYNMALTYKPETHTDMEYLKDWGLTTNKASDKMQQKSRRSQSSVKASG